MLVPSPIVEISIHYRNHRQGVGSGNYGAIAICSLLAFVTILAYGGAVTSRSFGLTQDSVIAGGVSFHSLSLIQLKSSSTLLGHIQTRSNSSYTLNHVNMSNLYSSASSQPISNNILLEAIFLGYPSNVGHSSSSLAELKEAINLNDTLLEKIPFLKKILAGEPQLGNHSFYDFKARNDSELVISQDKLNLLMKILGNEKPGWNHGVRELAEKMPISYFASNKLGTVGNPGLHYLYLKFTVPVLYRGAYYNISASRLVTNESKSSTVIMSPIFTMRAYQGKGFYDFYKGECSVSCLTVKINRSSSFARLAPGVMALRWIGYNNIITDADVDQDPAILSRYKAVIVLHDEYLTEREFIAISSQKKVLYLYPNAMFAEVSYNPINHTITLLKGHRYPAPSYWNAFGWKYDNSRQEKNHNCVNWRFNVVGNGMQLNCTPDNILKYDSRLWYAIRHLA